MNKKNIFIISSVVILIAIVCAVWFGLSTSRKTQTSSTVAPPETQDAIHVAHAQQNIITLQASLTKDPQNPEIKRSLSRALLISGDTQKAQQYIVQAISENGNNPQYYVDLGNVYFVQNEILKAEEQFNKAISVFNQNARSSQADILKTLSPLGNASSGMKQTLSLGKSDIAIPVVAYARLADIYLRQNKPSEAITLLNEGISLASQYPDFYMMLSQAYQRLHDTENETKYQKVFEELTSSYKRS